MAQRVIPETKVVVQPTCQVRCLALSECRADAALPTPASPVAGWYHLGAYMNTEMEAPALSLEERLQKGQVAAVAGARNNVAHQVEVDSLVAHIPHLANPLVVALEHSKQGRTNPEAAEFPHRSGLHACASSFGCGCGCLA